MEEIGAKVLSKQYDIYIIEALLGGLIILKKLLAAFLILALVLAMPVTAAGFSGPNEFTDNPGNRFIFGTESESYFVFGGVIDYNLDILEMPPGSSVFIPIIMENDAGDEVIPNERQLRDANVTLSYWVTRGEQLVQSVEIVDSRRDRITGMDAGMYVRIQLASHLPTTGLHDVRVHLALNVNRVFFPYTEIEVEMRMINRAVTLDRETVFGAQAPTLFQAASGFSGQVSFDMGAGVRFTGWVTPGQQVLIDYTADPIGPIVNAHPDATLLFRRFLGNGANFSQGGTLEIPVNPQNFVGESGSPELFVYQISRGSYNLTAIPASALHLDIAGGRLLIQTSSLGEYVISNQPLQTPIASETGILQGGPAQATETPADAPDGPNINVVNTGSGNPQTGMPANALPMEGAISIAIAAFIVAVWQFEKWRRARRAK